MSTSAPEMVAVLMTDLVGSTAMAERLGPDAAEDLRAEHFGLLRAALENTGGKEVKTLGDGLMAVFFSAAQSLACAVQIQQAVELRNRRAQEKLGVRIGVSLGDTTVADGDYFGEPVVGASRLCDDAGGGQIVVDALVRQAAGSRGGHSFHPLGDLELKGIAEPVQGFELRWQPAPVSGVTLPERLRELPATAYVGRVAERARLTELWTQAHGGSLRLVLIAGEAGVGKTRLSTHLALQARGQGATVLYGRCDEDIGIPYQPWLQALGHFVNEAPRAILDEHVERHGGDLVRLIPALADRVPKLPAPRESDAETERYILYASVEGLLQGAGERGPLLLILDDLHWADQPTLSLLRHVVTAGSPMRVMLLAAYRDSELARDHSLSELLADLHREQGVERLKLAGLESEDVLALMESAAGHRLDEDGRALAEEITRETDGNPFFAGELLRNLTESGAIAQGHDGRWQLVRNLAELGLPQSVREVIGRRVARLGPDARTALSAAAVIGRDFDVELLLAVIDLGEEMLLDLLDGAVAASLLRDDPQRAGRFTFTHALVEHTLCDDLGATRRARLHGQVATALERQCGDDPGERLGELAGHWVAAVLSGGDADKAVSYGRRAAERALAQLAPDEAARWYRQALELHDDLRAGERRERLELLLGLGEAERQVGNPQFRSTLLDAAGLAQDLGDADGLCRAVLANTRGWVSQAGAVDAERVQALEAAAGALPEGDPRRAPVLALLACELHYGGEQPRCRRLAAEAIEIARATDDPVALAHTLTNACWAIWVPDTLKERRLLSDELSELAGRLGDPWFVFHAAVRRTMLGMEAGDLATVESGLTGVRALAAAVPDPHMAWVRLLLESTFALIQGDLEAAERWTTEAFEEGMASSQPDASMLFGAQIFRVRYSQGRVGELVEQIVQLAGQSNSLAVWRAVATLALIESGREDEARELLLAENFGAVPWDQTWSVAIFLWADACSRLRVADRAAELSRLLAPHSGQLAAIGVVVFGSIDWALGTLATAQEHYEEAEAHFTAAAQIESGLGAPLLLARTHVGWARALLACDGATGLDRARAMLEQAAQIAAPLGAGGIMGEVAELQTVSEGERGSAG